MSMATGAKCAAAGSFFSFFGRELSRSMTLTFLGLMLWQGAYAQSQKAEEGAKSSAPGFLIEAAPKWVIPAPADKGGPIPRASVHNVLLDEQDLLNGSGLVSYNHLIRVVDEADGLSTAADIHIEFNPAYETLVLHKVDILRNGVRIDKLKPAKIKMLQRESNLEYQMYDGTVTASLVLDDVRVGDRVEFSYTLKGMNPVFDGKYVRNAWMASVKGPTQLARFRLVAPEARGIQHRTGSDVTIKERLHDGLRDTEYLRFSVPQLRGDQFTPASTYTRDQIELSEFSDWRSVSAWGEKLYAEVLASPSVQLKKTAQSLGLSDQLTPEARLVRALDFVQKEVRYFGTEIGVGSHRPSPPDAVIKQRFGDCKDKALLLVALLRESGMDATPVLVSTQYRSDIDASFATPLAFNHVIIKVVSGDDVYWLDGTRSAQTGPLSQRQSAGLGKGLVLNAGVDALVDLPGTINEERVAVDETYRINALSAAPELELRMTYSGEFAEYLRALISSQPMESVEARLNSDFSRFRPGAQKNAPLLVEEVAGQNALCVVQKFTMPKFWRFPEEKNLVGEYMLWNLIGPIRHPDETQRTQPFQIAYPGIYRHRVSIEFPEAVVKSSATKQYREEDAHLYLQVDLDTSPRKFTMRGELHLMKDVVTVAEWPDYSDLLRKASGHFGGSYSISPLPADKAERVRAEVNELVSSWHGLFAKNKPVTDVQSNAMVRRLVLGAELDAGRLSPELKAQVLHQRGIELDSLGFNELAQRDFAEARSLIPADGSLLADSAINYFESGQDEQALEYAKKALALEPSRISAYKTMAYVQYFEKNYAQARRNLIELLKNRSEVNDGYAAIWLYLVSKRNNEDGAAVVKPYLPIDQSAWPHPVLKYLTGTGTLEQAMEAARSGQKDPSRLCELYFYTGEKYLIEGQTELARESFRKSMDTGVIEFNEFIMSKRNLQSMGAL